MEKTKLGRREERRAECGEQRAKNEGASGRGGEREDEEN